MLSTTHWPTQSRDYVGPWVVQYNQQNKCLRVRHLVVTDYEIGISGALPSQRTTVELRSNLPQPLFTSPARTLAKTICPFSFPGEKRKYQVVGIRIHEISFVGYIGLPTGPQGIFCEFCRTTRWPTKSPKKSSLDVCYSCRIFSEIYQFESLNLPPKMI